MVSRVRAGKLGADQFGTHVPSQEVNEQVSEEGVHVIGTVIETRNEGNIVTLGEIEGK